MTTDEAIKKRQESLAGYRPSPLRIESTALSIAASMESVFKGPPGKTDVRPGAASKRVFRHIPLGDWPMSAAGPLPARERARLRGQLYPDEPTCSGCPLSN